MKDIFYVYKMYFGVNIILWSRNQGDAIVYLFNKTKKFNRPLEENEFKKELKCLVPVNIIKVHYVENKLDFYAPTAIIQVEYNDMYGKYKSLKINDLFPYFYEPTPFNETYRSTEFYKDLYVKKLPYKGLCNTSAKVLFHYALLFEYIL